MQEVIVPVETGVAAAHLSNRGVRWTNVYLAPPNKVSELETSGRSCTDASSSRFLLHYL